MTKKAMLASLKLAGEICQDLRRDYHRPERRLRSPWSTPSHTRRTRSNDCRPRSTLVSKSKTTPVERHTGSEGRSLRASIAAEPTTTTLGAGASSASRTSKAFNVHSGCVPFSLSASASWFEIETHYGPSSLILRVCLWMTRRTPDSRRLPPPSPRLRTSSRLLSLAQVPPPALSRRTPPPYSQRPLHGSLAGWTMPCSPWTPLAASSRGRHGPPG